MIGEPAKWSGTWVYGQVYNQGEMVFYKGCVFICRDEDNAATPPFDGHNSGGWVYLGMQGASPTRVSHKWNAKELRYPSSFMKDEMSDPAEVCQDCWKDADFKNSFRPDLHLYIIKELGVP